MCTDAAYEFDEGSDGAEQCEVLILAAAPVGVLLTVSVLAALQLLHPGGVSLLMTDAEFGWSQFNCRDESIRCSAAQTHSVTPLLS